MKQNPRFNEKNPFFGKKHTPEQIELWKKAKSGTKVSAQQQRKQLENTPKGENHPNWRGGIANGCYGPEFNKKYKNDIKTAYNFTCQLCEITNVDLDIHHIDYDKTNNGWENLIPLCKICHGKTNFNRDYWTATIKLKTKNKPQC